MKIYSEDPNNLAAIEGLPINCNLIPQISDLSKIALDQPLTQEEFLQALKDLKKMARMDSLQNST